MLFRSSWVEAPRCRGEAQTIPVQRGASTHDTPHPACARYRALALGARGILPYSDRVASSGVGPLWRRSAQPPCRNVRFCNARRRCRPPGVRYVNIRLPHLKKLAGYHRVSSASGVMRQYTPATLEAVSAPSDTRSSPLTLLGAAGESHGAICLHVGKATRRLRP